MDWHARYLEQAQWTAQLRAYLFNKIGLGFSKKVLELGCGTGAVLNNFPLKSGVHGLDINRLVLKQAAQNAPDIQFTCGDGADLPFVAAAFDVVFCHFVLLWTEDPLRVVAEMRRVTRKGGIVLALAEPDYGGRIDYPAELAELGLWQRESLQNQGADPVMGRKLAGTFNQAGLKQVETGIIGGEWRSDILSGGQEMEWQVLIDDLSGRVPLQDIRNLEAKDRLARERGERVLYIPTFYAWGVV